MDFFRVFLRNAVDEAVVRYDLQKEEAVSIEPKSGFYFRGKAVKADRINAGIYYVTQIRKDKLSESELVEAAIELQKEALWNRLKPEPELYIRSFFEDNAPVTQFWRPLAAGSGG